MRPLDLSPSSDDTSGVAGDSGETGSGSFGVDSPLWAEVRANSRTQRGQRRPGGSSGSSAPQRLQIRLFDDRSIDTGSQFVMQEKKRDVAHFSVRLLAVYLESRSSTVIRSTLSSVSAGHRTLCASLPAQQSSAFAASHRLHSRSWRYHSASSWRPDPRRNSFSLKLFWMASPTRRS